MSLQAAAVKREEMWRKYELHSDFLADFVLKELVHQGTGAYQLSALFSGPAIDAILNFGMLSANAYRRGVQLCSFGEGGATYRSLEEGKVFETLFAAWAEAGWVILTLDLGSGELMAKRATP